MHRCQFCLPMKSKFTTLLIPVMGIVMTCLVHARAAEVEVDLKEHEAVDVTASLEKGLGKEVLQVTKNPAVKEVDEPTFAKLKGITFRDGTIEVMVKSKLLKDAPDFARGFIGVAFRIQKDHTKFESIYVRPTNGRSTDEVRRARAIQYFAYPDYKFSRLREESPGSYEAKADIGLMNGSRCESR
jgi:hypothetical protein